MSKDDVTNIISKYLCSTKRSDDKQLGAKGVGFKVSLSYRDYFQFQCRKDGKEILCMMRKGDPLPEIDFLYEKDTTEPNGVKVIIDLSYYDKTEFSKKIRTQLIYFDNVFITDNHNEFDNSYKIYKNELFSYSKVCSDKSLHLNFGGVYYPLDFDKLEISRINLPIAINIELTDGIEPTLSREDIRYTVHAKEFIKNKINLIADWFVNKYNKTVIEFPSFILAKSSIDSKNRSIELCGETLDISDLITYSKIPISSVSVVGYNNVNLKHLSSRVGVICNRHTQIGEIDWHGRFTSKNNYKNIYNSFKQHKYLLDSIPVGNKKEYLKEICKQNSDIFKIDNTNVVLWFKTESGLIRNDNHSHKYSWYHILDLEKIDKKNWRALIQDAQRIEKEYINQCKDIRNFDIPQEWLDEKKQKRKYEGKILDKKQGEITYFFTRNKEYGGQMFDKKTLKISELGKEKCMVVYFTPQEKECALYLWEDIFFNLKRQKVKFVLINQRETKYVENLHNYKNWKEFMETNKFKKLATKLKAKKVMNLYSSILESSEFLTIMDTLKRDKKDLVARINKYIFDVDGSVSENAVNDMLLTCEENNLWDYSIMSDIKEMEKLAKEFEFLQALIIPSRNSSEENKRLFVKYVSQYILFNKLYKNDFEQFEICVKAPIEETSFINEGELIPENLVENKI